MINYVTINTALNTALAFDTYTGTNWAVFKVTFENANPGLTVVDIGASQFPTGQNWYSGIGQYQRLPYAGGETFATIQKNILQNIALKTDLNQYGYTFPFKGSNFTRTHDLRDESGILAALTLASATAASQVLPLDVLSDEFNVITLSTPADCLDFASAMINTLRTQSSAQSAQINAVKAMTTVSQLVKYIDPR